MLENNDSSERDNGESSEADRKGISRRLALQTSGIIFGGVQLFSTNTAATESKKDNVTIVEGSDRNRVIEVAIQSTPFKKIRNELSSEDLSISTEDTRVYRVMADSEMYHVVSFYPSYPEQGERALENNVAVVLQKNSLIGINAMICEYERTTPKWVHNYVVTEDGVDKRTTKIKGSVNGTLILNSRMVANIREVAIGMYDQIQSLQYTPGLAAFPFLVDSDRINEGGTFTLASTVAMFSVRDPANGLKI